VQREPRKFEIRDAKREHVPLVFGLAGAQYSGKTRSSLEIATGFQQVLGGDIALIDTEAGRATAYADKYRFKHVAFSPPYSPDDYRDAIEAVYSSGHRVIIVDSMSHEHEGQGGVLQWQEALLDEYVDRAMKSGDRAPRWKIEEKQNMRAWIKPKGARQRLIDYFTHLERVAVVLCFRAKESTKPVKKTGEGGKTYTEIVDQGWTPIAGPEFYYMVLAGCLLLPGGAGKPVWKSDEPGERKIIKLPDDFEPIFRDGRQLDREHGRLMALWATGQDSRPAQAPTAAKVGPEPSGAAAAQGASDDDPVTTALRNALRAAGARSHTAAFALLSESGHGGAAFIATDGKLDVSKMTTSECSNAIAWLKARREGSDGE
jgi:hypothetical protein